MKPGAISTALFALSCIATLILLLQLANSTVWSLSLLAIAALVAVSPYYQPIQPFIKVFCLIVAVMAFLLVSLGLLAATTGGTFRLPGEQARLLIAIGLIGAFGVVVFLRLK